MADVGRRYFARRVSRPPIPQNSVETFIENFRSPVIVRVEIPRGSGIKAYPYPCKMAHPDILQAGKYKSSSVLRARYVDIRRMSRRQVAMLSYSIIFKSEKMSRKRVANFSSSGMDIRIKIFYAYIYKIYVNIHRQNFFRLENLHALHEYFHHADSCSSFLIIVMGGLRQVSIERRYCTKIKN